MTMSMYKLANFMYKQYNKFHRKQNKDHAVKNTAQSLFCGIICRACFCKDA